MIDIMDSKDTSLNEAETTYPEDVLPCDQATPTILVVHASVGSGHRTAANAIAEGIRAIQKPEYISTRRGVPIPENVNVEVLDILDFGRIKFDGNKTASSFTGAMRPLYDLRWRYELTGRLLWGGGSMWNLMFPRFNEYVKDVRPMAIIVTHITAANVAIGARNKSGYDFPIICVPTDYEVEGWWPHLHADLFCVGNERMAETLRARKVPEFHIQVTGIPTSLTFSREYDPVQTRERFNLPQDKRLVMVLAGAYLPRPYVRFRKTMDEVIPYIHSLKDFHFIIIAGQDAEYANHVHRLAEDHRLTNVSVFEYVNDIAALMSTSDLIICKSGGLTVTECLNAQVPMVLLGKAYGQERVNVRMLTATGAAFHVTTARELLATLHQVDEHPESTEAMLVNASFIRRPYAALDIARETFRLATHEPSEDHAARRKLFLHFYRGYKPAHTR